MKGNTFASRDIRQIKRLVIFAGIVLLLILELSKLFLLKHPLGSVLLDTGFGLFMIFALVEIASRFNGQMQDRLIEEIEQRARVESQLRLRSSALEAAANAITITDKMGAIIWVNPAFVTLTGYEASEVLGKNPAILRSGHHPREFYTAMWQTILSGQPWHGEVVNKRKDGRLYTEEQTITPVLDEAGQVSHFVAIKLDITRRKEAEAELRQFAERLEAMHAIDQAILSRRAPEQMAQVALQRLHQIVPWSRASVMLLEEHTGMTNMITVNGQIVLTQDSGIQFQFDNEEALQSVRRNEVHYVPDLSQYKTDSNVFEWLYETGTRAYVNIPLMVNTGELIGLLNLGANEPGAFRDEHIAIAREIADSLAIAIQHTRLYDAERRQREKAEALQETGAALSSTLDFDQVLTLIVDQIARVVPYDTANIILIRGDHAHVTNSRGYELFGHDVAIRVANLTFDLKNTPNLAHILQTRQPLIIDDVQTYPGWLKEKAASHTRSWLGVPIFVHGEATAVFALSKSQPNYYHQNHVEMLQAFAAQASLALDNAQLYEQLRTHATQLEDRVMERTRELAEMNERLTELDRLKSKFISDISHELRTPITNMNVYLDLLEKGKPERHERYRQILKQETLRLTHLVENIFDESRQTSYLHQADYTLVDLNQVVADVLNDYDSQITARNLMLTSALDPDLPSVFGERSQLTRVVANLLANAINYTPAGSIQIKTFRQNSSIHLQVEDTGVGIDPEDLPHLFDRFYRGRHASQSTIPGTGLGLAVVQDIVGLHHGEVNVRNRAEGGAIFDIRLPDRMPLSRS
ncbi:MAG: GAF domain-containing protein [Chloroflexi bacterium]|nr:GAF domain-containing protein [Chloroflexota bacterium]